jgi:glycosyltransferase involved in cell wall biosynthesis
MPLDGWDGMKKGGEIVSIVIPAYNEVDELESLLAELHDTMVSSKLPWEVIVVDDGSTDGTDRILRGLEVKYPSQLRVITNPYNQGNGAAIKTGVRIARGTIIACMDADHQHNPQDLLKLLPYVTEYELVVGARTGDCQGGQDRNLGNHVLNLFASWFTGFTIQDLTSGYRLFRASAIKKYVDLLPQRFSYPTTSTLVFIKVGYRLKYVPIRVQSRRKGVSKIRLLRDGWRFLLIIVKIMVLFEPLRVFTPVALLSFALAAVSTFLSTSILGYLHVPNSGVLLSVLGILVLLLGLVGEQIAMLMLFVQSAHRVSEGGNG